MTLLEALQETLADEHAALYTCGVLGARTSQSAAPALHDAVTVAFDRHRARRDRLRTMVEDAGGDPVAAAAAYEVPGTLRTVGEIQAAARLLEERSVEVLAALVARSSGSAREWALGETVWSATWQLELGGVATTWPGAPELT